MNLLEKVCEELGVEIGELWAGSDGYSYRIGKSGAIFCYDRYGFNIGLNGYDTWELIFSGKLKPVWEPKKGEIYYVPFLNAINNEGLYDCEEWGVSDLYDQAMLERGLVFKTKEEAMECANKMLEAIPRGGGKDGITDNTKTK